MGEHQEWCQLGARLAALCPDKFDEILDALRETVDAHELIATRSLVYRMRRAASQERSKS